MGCKHEMKITIVCFKRSFEITENRDYCFSVSHLVLKIFR